MSNLTTLNENTETTNNLNIGTPEMYGAVGDGTTDDTTAVRNALSNHSYVLFGCGKTYLLSETITLNAPLVIDLNGSTIQLAATLLTPFTTTYSSISPLTVKNGTIQGTRTAPLEAFVTAMNDYYNNELVGNYTEDGIKFRIAQFLENAEYNSYDCIANLQCGIRLASYQSRFENLLFKDLDVGLFMDKRKNGSTLALNENKVIHCKFASCYVSSIYSSATCKNADGFMEDIIMSGSNNLWGVYMGCAGGWTIKNIKSYGTIVNQVVLKGMDVTTVDGLKLLADCTNICVYGTLYSNAIFSNSVISARQSGAQLLRIDKINGGGGVKYGDNRPVLLDGILFVSEEGVSNVVPILGTATMQASNVTYNDANGAFLPNSSNPINNSATATSNYELINTVEITEETTQIDFGAIAANYKKLLVIMEGMTGTAANANFYVDNTLYLTSNSFSTAAYAMEVELFNGNLLRGIMGSISSTGTTYSRWITSVTHNGLFKVGSNIKLTLNAARTTGTFKLYGMQ